MSEILLNKRNGNLKADIRIGGSKSISNRLLILNALYGNPLTIENLSDSEDTRLMQKALNSDAETVDVGHAGTAMRFLTAYFASQPGKEVVLTGSDRMKQRPIGKLVDSLRSLEADIKFLEKEGFPPMKIIGKERTGQTVKMDAGISSQFITALMLTAPKQPSGLEIVFDGIPTSLPYMEMTSRILNSIGIRSEKLESGYKVFPAEELKSESFTVESDWSSASYYYSAAALSETAEIRLSTFFKDSLQGDSGVADIYRRFFSVETHYEGNSIVLKKGKDVSQDFIELDLNDTPDIAQTIAVSCAGLKRKCKLTGLKTLKIKETDRLSALQNELRKCGVQTLITDDSFEIIDFAEVENIPIIKTYEDHRMAMSFAPLSLIRDIKIENPEVVKKSYPGFWLDFDEL